MSKQYEVNSGYYGIQYYDSKGNPGNFFPLGRMVHINNILQNIETNNISYRLSFTNDLGETAIHEITRYDLLGKQGIDEALMNKGVDITPYSLMAFRVCFQDMVNSGSYPILYTYRHVGFQSIECQTQSNGAGGSTQTTESLFYKSDSLIGPPNAPNYATNYMGAYDLSKHGSFAEWQSMICTDVVPDMKLLIAFLGGACAIITGLIGKSRNFTNPIFHLHGLSSTGKSCAAKVAASIYGRPFEEPMETDGILRNSIYGSWTGTENAIRDDCTGNHGMAIILNELGKSKI